MTKQEQRLAEGYLETCHACEKNLDASHYFKCKSPHCQELFCSEDCARDHVAQYDEGDYEVIDTSDEPVSDDPASEAYDADDFRDQFANRGM